MTQGMILRDNIHSIYPYYIFQSPKSAYFIKNNKNSITRSISNRNIYNISLKRKKDYY